MQNIPSPNFDTRAPGASPRYLILHYTGTSSADEAQAVFCNGHPDQPFGRLSPHYMADVDGRIIRFVGEDKRAWHAGKSFWRGCDDLNSWSIGIEVVNAGHPGGLPEFPQAQMESLAALCQTLIKRYNFTPFDVLGHSDVSVTRKIDPGENFPWQYLATQGVGFWPRPSESDHATASDALEREDLIRALLSGVGYAANLPICEVLCAFQRHYHPEVFSGPIPPGVSQTETLARLICLYRALPDSNARPVGWMAAP